MFEEDEGLWREQQIELLEEGKLNEIDSINLKVILIEMGVSDKRLVAFHLTTLIIHLLKWQFQSERRSRSWYVTIKRELLEISDALKQKSMKNHIETEFSRIYKQARRFAIDETGLSDDSFPEVSPWNLDSLLNFADGINKPI